MRKKQLSAKISDKEIRKYKFKSSLSVGFEIISISDLYRRNRKIITKPHRTDFYQIIWIQHGNPTHHINFSPVDLMSHSLLFLSKNWVHVFDTLEEYEGKVILFTEEFYCRNMIDSTYLNSTILYNNVYRISPIGIRECVKDQFAAILQQMETELDNQKDKHQPLILKNLLGNLLMIAEREVIEQRFNEIKPSPELDYLTQFKELLEKNFKINKSVSKYASELNISGKTLNKATTLILSKTPKEMIDERVVLEAKLLLAYNTSSVKEIAFDLGFEELTNFIKYFRKHTLTTPTEFRETLH
jgi:AraC-like DNA-binding protein